MLNNYFSNLPINTLLSEPDTLAVLDFRHKAVNGAVQIRLQALGCSKPESDGQSGGSDDNDFVEVWKTTSHIVERGAIGDCQWSRSPDFQFVSMAVPCDSSSSIEEITENVYRTILQTISDSEYPQLSRFWNILPNINYGAGDHENYKRFCSGRLAAFQQFKIDTDRFPAASAVGHYVDGITIYALSAKYDTTNLANPRQVDAFSYPRQYGPSSPSFARATTVTANTNIDPDGAAGKDLCFISGTASILGHHTVHKGDLLAQLHTTNDNILYLLEEAGRKPGEVRSLRVYLRHRSDYQQIREAVDSWYPKAHIIYAHADICRADLLVEIECFCVAD